MAIPRLQTLLAVARANREAPTVAGTAVEPQEIREPHGEGTIAALLVLFHRVNCLCLCPAVIDQESRREVGHEGNREVRLIAVAVIFSFPAAFLLWQLTVVSGLWWLGLCCDLLLGVPFWKSMYYVLWYGHRPADYVAVPHQLELTSADPRLNSGTTLKEPIMLERLSAIDTSCAMVNETAGEGCFYCGEDHDTVITRRCDQCNACFTLVDHHCGMIGTCVHEGNRTQFITVLSAGSAGLLHLCCCLTFAPENANLLVGTTAAGSPYKFAVYLWDHLGIAPPVSWDLVIHSCMAMIWALAFFQLFFLFQQLEFCALVYKPWWCKAGGKETVMQEPYVQRMLTKMAELKTESPELSKRLSTDQHRQLGVLFIFLVVSTCVTTWFAFVEVMYGYAIVIAYSIRFSVLAYQYCRFFLSGAPITI